MSGFLRDSGQPRRARHSVRAATVKSIAKATPRPGAPVTIQARKRSTGPSSATGVLQQRAVDQPLDRGAIVGVDVAAGAARAQARGGLEGERGRSGGRVSIPVASPGTVALPEDRRNRSVHDMTAR